MAFQDRSLVCKDCGKEFTWTASEQEFYQKKGFENEPVRCPSCRALKKARMNDDRPQRQSFEITCAECGKTDTVPFKPRGDRPVLCRDCFRKQRPS
jgi:CxxC-x17-CxxC domain-containing protein